MIAASGVRLAVAGALIGGALSAAAVPLVRAYLWGVEPGDPATYIWVAAFLIATAAISSIVPALRLTRLDPARTLRE
jgi:ABC-type antimicrobial peptide transport system permease subunit